MGMLYTIAAGGPVGFALQTDHIEVLLTADPGSTKVSLGIPYAVHTLVSL